MVRLQSNLFYNLLPLNGLFLLLIISLITLTPTPTHASSDPFAYADVSVEVACTLSSNSTEHFIPSAVNGQYYTVDGVTLHTTCNGGGDYYITAIGYTNDTAGNNVLYNSNNPINTGVYPGGATSSTSSSWGMKINSNEGYPTVIQNGYYNYSVVPSKTTTVVKRDATTAREITDSTVSASYEVYISPTQPAGTYTGAVKYTMGYEPHLLTMQEFNSRDFKNMHVGKTTQLVDSRTGWHYFVRMLNVGGAKVLFMYSNLDVPPGTRLTPIDSNVSAEFTMPTEAWTSGAQNYYCKAIMAVANDHYYYNWYAATANPHECDGADIATSHSYSLGDICPRGWRLPTKDEAATSAWRSAMLVNNGEILQAYGAFDSGALSWEGEYGDWWTSSNSIGPYNSYTMYYDRFGSEFGVDLNPTYYGASVRCMRTA